MTSELSKALGTLMDMDVPSFKRPKPVDLTVLATAIRRAGNNAWMAAISGSGRSPVGAARFERMQEPQPGDLVVEVSSPLGWTRDELAVGFLLRKVREPYPDQDLVEGEEPGAETVFYIQLLDGAEQRWVNAQFIAIDVTVS